MVVTLLHCPQSKHGPYHLVYNISSWPRGTVKNRGWLNAALLYCRDGTQQDEQVAAGAWRYQCWRYLCIDLLRADEARCGIDYDLCIQKFRGERLQVKDVAVAESVRLLHLEP